METAEIKEQESINMDNETVGGKLKTNKIHVALTCLKTKQYIYAKNKPCSV